MPDNSYVARNQLVPRSDSKMQQNEKGGPKDGNTATAFTQYMQKMQSNPQIQPGKETTGQKQIAKTINVSAQDYTRDNSNSEQIHLP